MIRTGLVRDGRQLKIVETNGLKSAAYFEEKNQANAIYKRGIQINLLEVSGEVQRYVVQEIHYSISLLPIIKTEFVSKNASLFLIFYAHVFASYYHTLCLITNTSPQVA